MSALITLAELRNQTLPTPDVLVANMLSAGETVLLVGRPKTGKSRLVQQLALCLSRGEPFLGQPIAVPHRVLLFDLENRPAGVRGRFVKMAQPNEDADARVLIYAPETLADETVNATSAGMERVERLVELADPEVVVIDTWRLFVGEDENKTEVILHALKALARLREQRPNLATVIVHHLRKEKFESPVRLREDPNLWVEAVSGHHALVGHVGACFGLGRENRDLIVFGGVARNAASTTLLLDEDEDSLRFDVASGEDECKAIMTEKEKDIWDTAKEIRQFTFTDLQRKAATKNKKAVSALLRKAESHHILRKEGLSLRCHRRRFIVRRRSRNWRNLPVF